MANNGRTLIDGQVTATIYGLIKNHMYSEAAEILQEKLQLYPKSRAALSLLAFCYYHMQDFENAAECYEQLQVSYPDVDEYKLYYAQTLYKSGALQEATKSSFMLDKPSIAPKILKLQAGIKYVEGDFPAAKTLVEQCPSDDIDTQVNMACLLFKEGQYQEALAIFVKAMEVSGKKPDLMYNTSLCHYHMQHDQISNNCVSEIIEQAIKEHPELSIGLKTEGVDVRSVGNTLVLHETHTVEAFNLRAALLWKAGDATQARKCLTDIPPRSVEELDPISLHNDAIMNMPTKATMGFEKLQFLLQQPICPPETFGNLLLLYCKYEYYDLAADVLAENAHLTFKLLSPFLYKFLETLILQQTSVEEAYSRFDDMATELAEELRRYTKKVQQTRGTDEDAARRAIKSYDTAMQQYVPVLMHQAKIYWDQSNYPALEKIFRKSVDKCTDVEAWKLNVAHTLFMQDNKYKEAINFYEPIVKKHYDELLQVSAIVLANLCVSYIMTSHNEEAEELMRRIEKEEEQIAYEDPDSKLYHLCIVNLVIGTLYCAKGNYEFGISRVMKSLEPYHRKLGTDTWFYAKRCFLSLMESMSKQMVFLQDSVILEIVQFFQHIENHGHSIIVLVEQPLEQDPMHEGKNTVAYEARYLKSLFLALADL
ncbi:intraflagellar transport protein 70A-like [Sycon ciliatum]|uniref:intraflagellar transport protein 70A-like n=1 Tax=Sycon ciliatum TaxID=27933 RepID=UPI0031F71E45